MKRAKDLKAEGMKQLLMKEKRHNDAINKLAASVRSLQ
jgi:hypothetical protein